MAKNPRVPNIKSHLEDKLVDFIRCALDEELTIEDEYRLETYIEVARVQGTLNSSTLAMAEALLADIKENG